MKLLWVVEGYFHHKNANGSCVFAIAQALKAQGHTIHVLTKAIDVGMARYAQDDVAEIIHWYRYDCDMNGKQIQALLKQNLRQGLWAGAQAAIAKLFFCFSRHNPPGFWHTNAIKIGLQQVLQQERFDAVIAASFPLETAVACAHFKKNSRMDCPFYFYQMDSYLDNYTLWPALRKHRKHIIRNVYEQATHIFTHKLIKPELESVSENICNKATFLEFPTLVPAPAQLHENCFFGKDGTVHCAYFGSLYGDIRRPETMLELFVQMSANVHLHVFGQSNIKNIKAWESRFHGRLHLHGWVSSTMCAQFMSETDVLVNLGNSITNQLPSKIFQYFATGRPVVNIVQSESCATLPYAKKYPTALTLCETQITKKQAAEQLIFFIEQHACDDSIAFKTIAELFEPAMPSYVAQQFEDVFSMH